MKTIITREIDGYNVVMGIDYPIIDSVATRLKVDNIVKDDPEMLEAAKVTNQIAKLHKAYFKLSNAKKRRFAGKMQTLRERFDLLIPVLAKLRASTDEKRWKLFNEDPIYFQPKPGERIISDEEAESFDIPRPENRVLLRNGDFIPDFRGVKYWLKTDDRWSLNEITKIGIPVPSWSVPELSLTLDQQVEIRAQFETDRISRLTDDEKNKESDAVKKGALTRAGFMKSELEIEGAKDPLRKSQAWYESELEQIEARYS